MFRLAPILLAAEMAVAPLAYTYDDFTLASKASFAEAPLSYFSQSGEYLRPSFSTVSDGLGVFSISSDLVYTSITSLPEQIPDNFTAFLVSGAVPLPEISDPRISSSEPRLSFVPNVQLDLQYVPFDTETSSAFRLVALRCLYYQGSVVPATAPCPLFVADSNVIAGNRGNYDLAFYMLEGVSYPTWTSSLGWSQNATFSDYLVPCLPNAYNFVPVSPDIDGEDTLSTLYRFGSLLLGDVQNMSAFLNFKIFGYPLYQLLLTTGFLVFAGWTVLRFIVP